MAEIDHKHCEFCVFWIQQSCRRRAPVVIPREGSSRNSEWPVLVYGNAWCGEFELDHEKYAERARRGY